MSILIIGANGSMGSRYKAILKSLGKDWLAYDTEGGDSTSYSRKLGAADGYIIATPTDTHKDYIEALAPLGKPILCEKPVVKDMGELNNLVLMLKDENANFSMTSQYQELVDDESSGYTYYDYFRTGNDGLRWDCIQIIGLAKGDYSVGNTSPIWNCQINGKRLSLEHMDHAYVTFVSKWLDKPGQSLNKIRDMHLKVAEAL